MPKTKTKQAKTKTKQPKRVKTKIVQAVGKNLRSFREAKKLSQYELAQTVGVSQATISKIEMGHSLPTIHFLHKLGYGGKSFQTGLAKLMGVS